VISFEYDPQDAESIYAHACRLTSKDLYFFYQEKCIESSKGKGDLGLLVEKLHFGIEPNSNPEPDFPKVGLELKVTGVRSSANEEMIAKERLVLSMIDYKKLGDEKWETSSFKRKCMYLLVILYRYNKYVPAYHQEFLGAFVWRPSAAEYNVIMSDWMLIQRKVSSGQAHLLSESDTQYLAANTKAANSAVLREQYIETAPKAKPRAFSYKPSFLTHIIKANMDPRYKESTVSIYQPYSDLSTNISKTVDDFLSNELTRKPVNKDTASIVRDSGTSIEAEIEARLRPFVGLTAAEISKITGSKLSSAKNSSRLLVNEMLGYRRDASIAEIVAAGIVIKTVTTKDSCKVPESMSFKQINYRSLLSEVWNPDHGPQAYLREVVTSRYLFLVFDRIGTSMERTFRGAMPFRLPIDAEEEAHWLWERIRDCLRRSEYDLLYSLRSRQYFHVRPKAKNAQDTIVLEDGVNIKKMAYWINRQFLASELKTRGFI
jgi:DNA mismatch repair protein MutH